MSPQYQLDKHDLLKTGRGLLLIIAGTALTYLIQQIPLFNFGAYQPIIVPFITSLLELARRFISDTQSV